MCINVSEEKTVDRVSVNYINFHTSNLSSDLPDQDYVLMLIGAHDVQLGRANNS